MSFSHRLFLQILDILEQGVVWRLLLMMANLNEPMGDRIIIFFSPGANKCNDSSAGAFRLAFLPLPTFFSPCVSGLIDFSNRLSFPLLRTRRGAESAVTNLRIVLFKPFFSQIGQVCVWVGSIVLRTLRVWFSF